GLAAHLRRGVQHGRDDVGVAGAPAQVALQALADLGLARVGVVAEQVDGGHQHARSAVAALQGVPAVERPLQRVPPPVAGQALDGADLAAVGLGGQDRAALHGQPVHEDGARTAAAGVAADLGVGLADVPPRGVEEKAARRDLVVVAHAVEGYADVGHGTETSRVMDLGTIRGSAVARVAAEQYRPTYIKVTWITSPRAGRRG